MQGVDVERKRQLFGAMAKGLFDNSSTYYDELINRLQIAAFSMKNDVDLERNRSAWAAHVSSDRIVELYIDMLMEKQFFDQSSVYIRLVLYGISFFASSVELEEAQNILLEASIDVWMKVWDMRRRFSVLHCQDEDARSSIEYWVRLVCTWADMYIRRRGPNAPSDLYLPHVGFHLWILYPDCLDTPYQCTLNAVGAFIVDAPQAASSSRAREFYLGCVQASHGAGGEALALKLIAELRGASSSLPKLVNLVLPIMSWLAAAVQTPFMPAASKHELLGELRRTVDMLAQFGGEHTRALVLAQKVAMQLARQVLGSFPKH